MDVNYILIKGNKHFKCHSLAEMAIYFSLSVTSNGSVICDGYHDTMSYSKEWSHEDIITDFIRQRQSVFLFCVWWRFNYGLQVGRV